MVTARFPGLREAAQTGGLRILPVDLHPLSDQRCRHALNAPLRREQPARRAESLNHDQLWPTVDWFWVRRGFRPHIFVGEFIHNIRISASRKHSGSLVVP